MPDLIRVVCPDCGAIQALPPGTQRACTKCGTLLDCPTPPGFAQPSIAGTADDRQVSLAEFQQAETQALAEAAPDEVGTPGAGRYVVRGVIGQGGMGEVLLCLDRDTRRLVAMKRMLATTIADPSRRARFVEEAQVTAQLEHPNVVPVHELSRDAEGGVYYTMKLVKGRSLADILKEIKEGQSGKPQSHARPYAPRGDGSSDAPRPPLPSARPYAPRGDGSSDAPRPPLSSLSDLLQAFLKVCDAVAFAHSRGVVHRDLKPANVMVGDFGEVLVMDWGLAKVLGRADLSAPAPSSPLPPGEGRVRDAEAGAAPTAIPPAGSPKPTPSGGEAPSEQDDAESRGSDPRGRVIGAAPAPYPPAGLEARGRGGVDTSRAARPEFRTLEGSAMGTPGYMAPEQAEGQLDRIDARSDIYSLGAILYEILTLERPVEGPTPMMLLVNTVKGRVIPPEQRAPGRSIPRELAAIAMKCLSKGRARRYASALDLRRDVTLFLEGRSVSASPDSFAQAIAKLVKRNKGISAAIGAAAVVLVVVTAFFLINLKRQRDDAVGARATAESERKAAQEARDRQRATALAASRELAEQAVRAADAGHFAEADLRADGAVKVMPDSPWGHYALAMIARQRLDTKTARELLEKALSFDASHDQSRAALSQLLAQAGDIAKASALVSRLDQVTDWRSLASAGEALVAAGKYPDAVKAYERAVALMEKDPTVLPQASAEMRGRLVEARAEAACVGFHESIRKLPAEEQQRRISAKFSQIHGTPMDVRFEIQNGVLTGVDLGAASSAIRSLQPLKGLSLTRLICRGTQVRDLGPLKGMPLTSLDCNGTQVSDLGPLKGMPLTSLSCHGTRVSDLGPLKGMPLTSLNCWQTSVSHLGPLKGMSLTSLNCAATQVSDLGPLKGMPLTSLDCMWTPVSDLSPLKGMLLTYLNCGARGVSDLGPLKGMPLTSLNCWQTSVSDLGPLKGMALTSLNCGGTQVSDLGPLEGMKLERFTFTPKSITKGVELVRGMKTMREIGDAWGRWISPEEFWKKYDAGEFK